jgi:hypothetical protein
MRKKEQKELEDLYTARSRAFPLDTEETDLSDLGEWSETA